MKYENQLLDTMCVPSRFFPLGALGQSGFGCVLRANYNEKLPRWR